MKNHMIIIKTLLGLSLMLLIFLIIRDSSISDFTLKVDAKEKLILIQVERHNASK